MNHSFKPVFCFGPFRYDSGEQLLFRENETVPLAPKVEETLRVLVERHERDSPMKFRRSL
jgi:DNA-binding winged helix-turn-helix (wHTH) protein